LELFVAREKVFDIVEEEPLYGDQYLPRKFKIGMTVAGDNCVDIYSHDLGLVYHPSLESWTVLVGGGLAQSHGLVRTHALLAQPLGQIPTHLLIQAVGAVIGIQRDFGNRDDRRIARMKYLVESWGLERFRQLAEKRMGAPFEAPRELGWESTTDHLVNDEDSSVLGVKLPGGRIHNTSEIPWALALRDVVKSLRPKIHITHGIGRRGPCTFTCPVKLWSIRSIFFMPASICGPLLPRNSSPGSSKTPVKPC
jgi:sulfite reductase (ferredoxin)